MESTADGVGVSQVALGVKNVDVWPGTGTQGVGNTLDRESKGSLSEREPHEREAQCRTDMADNVQKTGDAQCSTSSGGRAGFHTESGTSSGPVLGKLGQNSGLIGILRNAVENEDQASEWVGLLKTLHLSENKEPSGSHPPAADQFNVHSSSLLESGDRDDPTDG